MRPPAPSAVGLRPATPAIRPRGPRTASKAPRASRPAPTPRPHRSPSHTCMRTARVNLLLGRRRIDPVIRGERTIRPRPERSEEHTSELQSRLHLVCRLLLEKKKKTHMYN